MHNPELQYRPDVDGLRAIAVLLVLGFHLGAGHLQGGFVGVDIFFVISGYLITGIIAKELEQSRFSVLGFYERRARRILPALMVVFVASTLLSLHYLLPAELVSYAKSLLAATFSYSNFYFWSTADYFDAPAQTKPLLHTWSLAIEEQFYLILPLLLLFLSKKWPRGRNLTLIAIGAASFACSVWMSLKQPDSAFYLPVSRAWEFIAGSIVVLDIIPPIRLRWMRECTALMGISLIAYTAIKVNPSTPFPGFAALLPCGGALLLIAAGRFGTTAVGRCLSLKPLTFIGLISYSVYLWHWPLIVYTKMGFLPILSRSHRGYTLGVGTLSLALGALSWQFIEKPFRSGRFRSLNRSTLFATAGIALAASAAVALIFTGEHGFESRFPESAVRVAESANSPQENRLGSCFITTRYTFSDFRKDICLQIDPGKKNYLLLGDSHSAALWYGLNKVLATDNVMQATASGCKANLDLPDNENCRDMMRYIFGDFLLSHKVDAVLLTARWTSVSDFARMQGTIAWCAKHQVPVIIFGPVMEFDTSLPKLLAYSIAFHEPSLAQRHERTGLFEMDAQMREYAEHLWNVRYLSIIDVQCPDKSCLMYADRSQETAMLGDDNHLSSLGSQFVMARLMALQQLPGR
jgi:peptidoglycan/LPS O-acetylase OafA/YrhL